MPGPQEIIGSIQKAIDKIIKIDQKIGLILLIFFCLLMSYLSIHVAGFNNGEGKIDYLVIIIPLLISISIVLILGSLRNTFIGKISTYITILYLVAGTKQFLLPSLPPPLPPFHCFLNPRNAGCPGSSQYSDTALASSSPIPISGNTPRDGKNSINDQKQKRRVFLQFAGSIPRDAVKELALKLWDSDWRMQGMESGGERTPAAAGFNEIRYFNEADKDLATQLAIDVKSNSTWDSRSVEIRLIPLSSSTAQADQIEIWISN